MMKKLKLVKIIAHFELENENKDFTNLEVSMIPGETAKFTARNFPIPDINKDNSISAVINDSYGIIDKFKNNNE